MMDFFFPPRPEIELHEHVDILKVRTQNNLTDDLLDRITQRSVYSRFDSRTKSHIFVLPHGWHDGIFGEICQNLGEPISVQDIFAEKAQ
jgi:hypothetical protein